MRIRWIVAAAAAVLVMASCAKNGEEAPLVNGDWAYWLREPEGDKMLWIAALHGDQGWPGANSAAPPISLVVQWEEGELINAGIMAEEGEFSRECTRNGCYAYVRQKGHPWVVLRLSGVEDEASETRYLTNPWTLYDVLQAGGRLEVDIPLEGRGRCVYSLEASGYSREMHLSAGPLEEADKGLEEVMSDGRSVGETLSGDPPDWVKWPTCHLPT